MIARCIDDGVGAAAPEGTPPPITTGPALPSAGPRVEPPVVLRVASARLRAALLRGDAAAVREVLATGVRGVRLVSLAAQAAAASPRAGRLARRLSARVAGAGVDPSPPAGDLAHRIDEAAIAVAFAAGGALARGLALLDELDHPLPAGWQGQLAIDEPGRSGGGAASAGASSERSAEPSDGRGRAGGDGGPVPTAVELALVRAPRIGGAVARELARRRPDLLVRVATRLLGARGAGDRRRGVELLVAATPDAGGNAGAAASPADAASGAARRLLAAAARGRLPRSTDAMRTTAIEGLARRGVPAALAIARETLERDVVSDGTAGAVPSRRSRRTCGSRHVRPTGPRRSAGSGRGGGVGSAASRRLVRVVARAIGTIGDGPDRADAIATLAWIGRRHREPVVRCACLEALRTTRPLVVAPATRALALAQLRDRDPSVAAAALAHLRSVLSPAAFLRTLLDAIPGVRPSLVRPFAADLAWRLASFRHERTVRRLARTNDPDLVVAFVMAAGWRAATGGDVPPTGSEARELRRETTRLLVRVGNVLEAEASDDGSRSARAADRALRTTPATWPERRRATVFALLRAAARAWSTGRSGGRTARRHRCDPRAAFDLLAGHEPPVSRATRGTAALVVLLRVDPDADALRSELVRGGGAGGGLAPDAGLRELMRLPDGPAVRAAVRAIAREHPLGFVVATVRDGARRTGVAPWLLVELVHASLFVREPEAVRMLAALPARTGDEAFDRRWLDDGEDAEQVRRRPVWARMRSAARELLRAIGGEGRRVLGSGLRVRPCREGAGRTWPPGPGAVPVIEVDPRPLLEGGRRAWRAVAGVGMHEVGHHLQFRDPGWAAAAARMRRAGLHGLFNLVADEQLERRLRARSRRYGQWIDAAVRHHLVRERQVHPLAALAAVSGRAPGELRDAVRRGRVPGRLVRLEVGPGAPEDAVCLRPGELAAVGGLAAPEQAFAAALRTGRVVACRRARAARAHVPRDLAAHDANGLADLVERLAEILGGTEQERRRRGRLRAAARRDARIGGLLEALAAAAGAGRGDRLEAAPDGGVPARTSATRRPGRGAGRRRSAATRGPGERDAPTRPERRRDGGRAGDLGRRLERVVRPERDERAHARLAAAVRRDAAGLRRELERLGTQAIDDPAAPRGARLDVAGAQRLPLLADPRVLVDRRDVARADAAIGVLIDRSGSMAGAKIELARRFAAVVAEAARPVRGVAGFVAAFDDTTWFDLGDVARTSVATLEAGDGNDDAAALATAGDRLRRFARRHRVLVLVSDGAPTECTVQEFHDEAARLERRGIRVVHVVIDRVHARARLPRCVDLVGLDMDEAVRRFARLAGDLVRRGGRGVPPSRPYAATGGSGGSGGSGGREGASGVEELEAMRRRAAEARRAVRERRRRTGA